MSYIYMKGLHKAHYLLSVVSLLPQNPYGRPRTIIATKIKKTLLSRVVVAVVAFLYPLCSYQNATVSYLNVDVAMFAPKKFWGQPKNHGDFRCNKQKICFSQERVLLAPLTGFLVAPKSP